MMTQLFSFNVLWDSQLTKHGQASKRVPISFYRVVTGQLGDTSGVGRVWGLGF